MATIIILAGPDASQRTIKNHKNDTRSVGEVLEVLDVDPRTRQSRTLWLKVLNGRKENRIPVTFEPALTEVIYECAVISTPDGGTLGQQVTGSMS